MPRLPAMLLAALAGTAHAPWGGMDQNLLDCEYDLPQHACPTCEGAPLGLAGGMPDAVVALTPRCIEAEGGCCEHDGFEYFLKASLARYQSGNVVSFFYPGKADMVSWVARDDAMAGGREDRGSISAPGRCVWSNDWTVRPPARRVTRLPRDADLTPVRARVYRRRLLAAASYRRRRRRLRGRSRRQGGHRRHHRHRTRRSRRRIRHRTRLSRRRRHGSTRSSRRRRRGRAATT